ncbi:MAG: hypothetical protein RBT71_08350 [Flavobacteriales bacterium]|jgi:hypothetical protein|nr:hypothetical protein [Flavobacteriales bacterium]
MWKPLATLCLAPFLAPEAGAQNIVNDSTAAVIAYWGPGDTWSHRVQRHISGERTGRTTYRLDFRVADATDSSYVVDCTIAELRAEARWPDDPRQRAVFQRLLTAMDGLRLRFGTDEAGVPLALLNMPEVEEHARQVMHRLLDGAMGPDEHRAMRMALAPVLDPEVMAQDALDDIGHILFPFGVAYITGRAEEVQAETRNPLGGAPFPTQQTFTMTALDTAAATAAMYMHQHIDPKGVDDAIDALIDSSGGAGLQGEARERLRRTIEGIQVEETMEITVDLHGAHTVMLLYTRESTVRGAVTTESRRYDLLR